MQIGVYDEIASQCFKKQVLKGEKILYNLGSAQPHLGLSRRAISHNLHAFT